MNAELLLKVKEAILKEPHRFDMAEWLTLDAYMKTDEERGETPIEPTCDTVACIAGWALILSGKPLPIGSSVQREARKVLDIDSEEADGLFFLSDWPADLQERFEEAESEEEEAKIAAERIDRFIQRGRWE